MQVKNLKRIADAIAVSNYDRANRIINALLREEKGMHWHRDLRKLQAVMYNEAPAFSIFAKDGNGKLPFLAFSSLPGQGFCPGAGDCLEYCYSYRAWRYPAAFCRQAQNIILVRSIEGRRHIKAALHKFKPKDGSSLDFRLYVDGDFGSFDQVVFWMSTLKRNPWLNAYGYSKSFEELISYGLSTHSWPTNYTLNISSGSRHSAEVLEEVKKLPITRGEFIAVPLGRKVKSTDHGTSAHNRELRQAFGAKAFTCPGKCGTCTNAGHACGSSRFSGIPIIIAVH